MKGCLEWLLPMRHILHAGGGRSLSHHFLLGNVKLSVLKLCGCFFNNSLLLLVFDYSIVLFEESLLDKTILEGCKSSKASFSFVGRGG